MILLAFSYRVPTDTEHMYGRNSRVVLCKMIFSEKIAFFNLIFLMLIPQKT